MGNSTKARSRDTAPRMILTPLYAKSHFTAPALLREYVGKNPIGRGRKGPQTLQKTFQKNFGIMSRQRRHDYNGSDWSSPSRLFSDNEKRSHQLQNGCHTSEEHNAPSYKESQQQSLNMRNTRWGRTLSSWINRRLPSRRFTAFVTGHDALLLKASPVFVRKPHRSFQEALHFRDLSERISIWNVPYLCMQNAHDSLLDITRFLEKKFTHLYWEFIPSTRACQV